MLNIFKKMTKIDATIKYPSFFLDTEKKKAIRKKIQKPFSQEEFLPFFIFRPISIYLAEYLVERTSISANMLTMFMAFLSLVAPLWIYFVSSQGSFFFVSFLLYTFIYFLDVLDGEVARLRQKTSIIGEIFDAVLWFYLPVLYIVYLYKLEVYFSFSHLVVFALMSISTVVMSGILRRLYTKKKYGRVKRKYYDVNTVLLFTIRFFLTQGAVFIIAPGIYYLGINMIYLQVYIYFALSLYFFNSLYGFYNLIKEYDDK